jgi:DNA-binding protein H-NS
LNSKHFHRRWTRKPHEHKPNSEIGKARIEWLDIQLDTLSPEDKTKLVTEILDTLPAGALRQIRDIAEEKRQGKLEDTKQLVIDKMRAELEQAGIDPDAINVSFGRRRRSKSTLRVKYRSPDGEEWSGRGVRPTWLAALETRGHNREEFRVEE